jgi:hypothetical protein
VTRDADAVARDADAVARDADAAVRDAFASTRAANARVWPVELHVRDVMRLVTAALAPPRGSMTSTMGMPRAMHTAVASSG